MDFHHLDSTCEMIGDLEATVSIEGGCNCANLMW